MTNQTESSKNEGMLLNAAEAALIEALRTGTPEAVGVAFSRAVDVRWPTPEPATRPEPVQSPAPTVETPANRRLWD